MKRIFLFLATNVAVIVVISIIMSIFNVQPYLTKHGIDHQSLLIYASIIGFTGAFISLFMSKFIAKTAFDIKIIERPETEVESWLQNTVTQLADKAKIGIPEIGIYDSTEPNAFATGWNRNHALVAVSTGILNVMDRDELLGVLGHEISHVANGDMVTMTLLQGVVNTFVIFFARIAAYFVSAFLSRGENAKEEAVGGLAYYGTAIVFEILFGLLASLIVMWFSRYREFRADAGSTRITSTQSMIRALQKLQQTVAANAPEDNRAPALAAFKIARPATFMEWFSSHPPLEKRIAALNRAAQSNG